MPFAHPSPDAQALARAFMNVLPGERISYADLSRAISRDVRRARHLIHTAAGIAQREAGAVFVNEVRSGYRRLTAEEAAAVIGTTTRGMIRRRAVRAVRAIKAATSRCNTLPPEVQRRASAEMATLGLVALLTRDRPVQSLAGRIERPAPVAAVARDAMQRLGMLPRQHQMAV